MASSTTKSGYGTRILYNVATTTEPADLAAYNAISWNTAHTIGELQEISLPGSEVSDIEVTHTLSPGGVREYIPALKDRGSLSGTANLRVSEYAALLNTVSGVKCAWKIETCSAGAADDSGTADMNVFFMGHLSLSNPSLPHDGKRSVAFTLKVGSDTIVDTATAALET